MNDLELMHCIERSRRSERRPDMLHILDEMAKRLQTTNSDKRLRESPVACLNCDSNLTDQPHENP